MYVIKGRVNNQDCYYVGLKKQKLWGSEWDVRTCSSKISGATKFKSMKKAEDICFSLLADNFKIYPVCPRCHKDYDGHPALSRKDNKTKICPSCGTQEAMFEFVNHIKKNKATN